MPSHQAGLEAPTTGRLGKRVETLVSHQRKFAVTCTQPMLQALRARDPGLLVTRRAVRTAIVLPAVFALGIEVMHDPAFATFAAFGAFAQILFVGFTGSLADRAWYQVLLAASGAGLVALGTLVSRWTWAAALMMAVVAFIVHYAGVVSSIFANASNPLLLAFILAVSLPAPASTVGNHVAGWVVAGGTALVANLFLWPAPASDPLHAQVLRCCRLLARWLRTGAAFACGGDGTTVADRDAVAADARESVVALNRAFYSTPNRPSALTTSTRATVRLVDELGWLAAILENAPPDAAAHLGIANVCAVKEAAADTLDTGCDLLAGSNSLEQLDLDLDQLRSALVAMEATATTTLSLDPTCNSETVAPAGRVVSALEPTFRAQEITFAVSAIANNVRTVVAAEHRSWWQRLLGQQSAGRSEQLEVVRWRARAHLDRHSVWLHNSIRAAVALTLAVVIANATGVQHSFWVVLGTLSVLRSNAMSTGQNILAAIGGTLGGLVIGSAIVIAIGMNDTVLWVLLPVAVCLAGLAPAFIGFAAGQAAFSIALLILFNIIAPAGWRIGLVRIEDIAIGCAVSLLVGLLFWPRGAAAAMRDALAEAYADSATYVQVAVATLTDASRTFGVEPEQLRAAAAARRLDDAFRQLMTERGAQQPPLADVTRLVTGVAGIRLAADAIVQLWSQAEDRFTDRAQASAAELAAATGQVTGWYHELAGALQMGSKVPDPVTADDASASHLVDAVRRDLQDDAGHATPTAIRMIWTADHVDATRRLQQTLLLPARHAATQQAQLRASQRHLPRIARRLLA